MSSIEGIFSSNSGVTTGTGGTGTGVGARAGYGQAFLEGVGLTVMDLDKRLHYLPRNLTLKFEAIYSFSFSLSSQVIGGTTRSNLTFGSLLEAEEDEDDEEDEVDEEERDTGGEVLAF